MWKRAIARLPFVMLPILHTNWAGHYNGIRSKKSSKEILRRIKCEKGKIENIVDHIYDPMERLAFKMKLNPGQKAAYQKRHDEIWPELKKLLTDSGVSEYSIFFDEETDTLFAFQKVSGSGNSQDLAENPIVQKWWKYMADIMKVNPDSSPISMPLEEVFYMD